MKKIQKKSFPQLDRIFHSVVWTITPRPVWIVGTCNGDGTPNLSTITCVSNTPGPPENIIVSMSARQTIANILRTGEFSVNLCNVEMVDLVNYVGTVSGVDGAKDAIAYDFTWGKELRVPVLDASHCVMECKVSHTHEVGDFHTFFGEVVAAHIDADLANPPMDSNESIMKWFQSIDIHKMNPLVYHSIQKYFQVGEKV